MKRFLPLLLASCAFARPMTASNGDLADYRAVALAKTEGDRLSRATRYLDRHPNGAWADDVRTAFANEEPAYYRACTTSRSAAIDYLAWLPHGPHAEAALSLVRSFDEHEPEDEQSRMLKAAHENEARLERMAQERTDASEAAVEAARVAIDGAIFGHKLEEAHDLSRWLLGGLSFGRTPTERTRKLPFTVPTRTGPVERVLELTLDVQLLNGTISFVQISGPDLFQRWAEAALVREVTREEARRYALDAIDALARARGGNLRVELGDDRVDVLPK